MKTAVTILSGGMDSSTLAFQVFAKEEGFEYDKQHFVSFNYGQRHVKELECARAIANLLKSEHTIIDLSKVGPHLKGSSLTDNVEMPEGFYAEENMRLTVVPNRNAIMLSIAWGIAVGEEADAVFYGAHAGDHFIYEDCRPEFVDALSFAFRKGTHGEKPDRISAPFLAIDKAEILRRGLGMGVPYDLTWTCYKGGSVACGVCGSCQERLWSFDQVGKEDPLPYASRKLYMPGEKVAK